MILEDGGSTLAHRVKALGPLSLSQIRMLAIPLIRALEAVHLRVVTEGGYIEEGQTHNDVKPSNILVDNDGKVKLIDLDVASLVQAAFSSKRGPVSGSYEWSGTDALQGYGQAPKDDLDALGQVLMWAATGKPLWHAPAGQSNKDSTWRDALAQEKQKWRSQSWNARAKQLSLPPETVSSFQKYYDIVERLKAADQRPNYDALCDVWKGAGNASLAWNGTTASGRRNSRTISRDEVGGAGEDDSLRNVRSAPKKLQNQKKVARKRDDQAEEIRGEEPSKVVRTKKVKGEDVAKQAALENDSIAKRRSSRLRERATK